MGTGLTDSQKELIGGIVLGRGSGVTDIKSWPHFLKSGMSHLLVASGAQVSLSIFPLILLADYVNMSMRARKLIYTIAATLLFLLLLIVGLEPSILRAVTSCYMFLLARTINRKCQSLNIIYATALLWLWINPSLIRNIGFQLSYSASWGLIYIYPRLRLLLIPDIASKPANLKRKITRRIYIFSIEIILLMLAAQGAVMPVLSHHFHRLSFSGFIANIIAIPLSGLIMYMGMAAALTGQISTPLAGLINIINGFLLNTLNLTARLFASIPYIPSPSNGMLGLLMPYTFMALFFEARFKPYGLVKALDIAQKILYPLDNLKNLKPFWRFRLID
jgi:competence protein ComEC